MTTTRLIERWLPIAEIGIESVRERTPMTPFPAPNRLHVWWARRPLVASRAAVLASILPEDADRDAFKHALGIHGDPVASRRRIDAARQRGVRFEGEAYSYPRAFAFNPAADYLRDNLQLSGTISILDPTAGGGAIPLEAIRLGLTVFSNDLNPVASLLQKATIDFPRRSGKALRAEFNIIAEKFVSVRNARISDLFPAGPDDAVIATNYLWARTIRCPYCAGIVPLSPNWRLTPSGTGGRIVPHQGEGIGDEKRRCSFEIVDELDEQSDGTVAGGDGVCPYLDCGRAIAGEEIKRQAQAGEMGDQPFAIAYKKKTIIKTQTGKNRIKWVRGYRAPTIEDDNSDEISSLLAERLPEWEAMDVVPNERVPEGSKTDEPRRYDVKLWRDMFSPRQLLTHGVSAELFREMLEEDRAQNKLSDVRSAAYVYLAISLDKMLNYNSRMSVWMPTREVTANTFNRHDLAFCWSHVEMSLLTGESGTDWACGATGKALDELINMVAADKRGDMQGRSVLLGWRF